MTNFLLKMEPVVHHSFGWVFKHCWSLSDFQKRQIPDWELTLSSLIWAIIIIVIILLLWFIGALIWETLKDFLKNKKKI